MEFLEMQTAVYDDLSVANTDAFYSLAYIKRIINRAKNRVENAHDWPHLERAMTRDSEANQEYYNYPENWKQDSIYKLKYNGDDYEKVRFKDYLQYQEDYDNNATDKIFSDFRNRFFINPKPAILVTAGIEFWGQEYSADLSGDTDETPFTLEREVEEIIIELSLAMALKKGRGSNYQRGMIMEKDALTKLEIINRKILKRQSSYRFKNRSMFKELNLFPGGATRVGNFIDE